MHQRQCAPRRHGEALSCNLSKMVDGGTVTHANNRSRPQKHPLMEATIADAASTHTTKFIVVE